MTAVQGFMFIMQLPISVMVPACTPRALIAARRQTAMDAVRTILRHGSLPH